MKRGAARGFIECNSPGAPTSGPTSGPGEIQGLELGTRSTGSTTARAETALTPGRGMAGGVPSFQISTVCGGPGTRDAAAPGQGWRLRHAAYSGDAKSPSAFGNSLRASSVNVIPKSRSSTSSVASAVDHWLRARAMVSFR